MVSVKNKDEIETVVRKGIIYVIRKDSITALKHGKVIGTIPISKQGLIHRPLVRVGFPRDIIEEQLFNLAEEAMRKRGAKISFANPSLEGMEESKFYERGYRRSARYPASFEKSLAEGSIRAPKKKVKPFRFKPRRH